MTFRRRSTGRGRLGFKAIWVHVLVFRLVIGSSEPQNLKALIQSQAEVLNLRVLFWVT